MTFPKIQMLGGYQPNGRGLMVPVAALAYEEGFALAVPHQDHDEWMPLVLFNTTTGTLRRFRYPDSAAHLRGDLGVCLDYKRRILEDD